MLKIHNWSVVSQRNTVKGVVETTAWFTIFVTVPLTILIKWKFVTRPAVPMELQLASKSRNLAGTVLPCLKALGPVGSMGGRIVWPGWPSNRQLLVEATTWYTQLWVTELPLQSAAVNTTTFGPAVLQSIVPVNTQCVRSRQQVSEAVLVTECRPLLSSNGPPDGQLPKVGGVVSTT